MATEYLFSNNATTTLAQSVSATATVLNVAEGTGALFPSPSSGQAFAVTLVDAATGLTNEICYCTSRSGDQLTVIRGREGTNAIAWSAGDTCANYITADVMESWLQESDLNGYATQSWADGRYIRSPANPNTDARILTISRNKASGGIFAAADDGSNTQLQPAGDYATNPALNTETTNRTNADTNLQNQINNRVLKTGDTMSWLEVDGGNVILKNEPGTTTAGQFNYSQSVQCETDGRAAAAFFVQEQVGGNIAAVIRVGWLGDSDWLAYYLFDRNGNIQTPKGLVAFESDISNLQNQINGKQPAGNYVTGTSAGKKIVTFTASVSGTQDISFSGLSSVDVVLGSCSTQPGSSNTRGGIIQINSWTSNSVNVTGKFTSTNISDSTDLPCYFVAIGDE